MKNGFGLLEQLDFGAGAYYYADIPGFASLVNGSHYQSPVSMPVLIILFLLLLTFSLVQQIYTFLFTIYNEIVFRL